MPAYINERAMRFADVILLLAECELNLNNTAQAIGYIDQIRTRGGNLLSYSGKTDAASVKEELIHQRAIEFFKEGERFYDLRRWGLLEQELKAQGLKAWEEEELPGALYLEEYDFLGKIEAFREGKFYVQDVSSMQAGVWAVPKPGDFVLDVCAAPGGKSIHAAETLLKAEQELQASGQGVKTPGIVEARDLTEYKVSLIKENIMRCGLPNIRAVQADARILDHSLTEKADIVLADLPCSGLGVLGRKPDIKYKMTAESCQELCMLQRQILHTVQQYVKPGGILLYSTCTINPAENQENTAWFLQRHPAFQLERQEQILPGKGKNDGFFLAKMRKESKSEIIY